MNLLKKGKIFILGVLLTAGVAANSMAAHVTTTANANVRAKATVKSTAVTTMNKGTKRKVLGVSSNGNWYKVMMNGKKGYVHKNRVKVTGSLSVCKKVYSNTYFRRMGELYWGGWRWTWYSQKVLSGGGLSIPGRHVDSDGYVCDKNDYICLASSTLSKGTVITTPLGKKGKIYDSGCLSNTIDVYVNW